MKKVLTCAALSVALLSGCSVLPQKNGIIKVNDNVITKAEFDKAIDKEIDNSPFKAFGGAANFVKSDDNVMYLIYNERTYCEIFVRCRNCKKRYKSF